MDEALRKDVIQWEVRNWGKTLDFWQPHLPVAEGKKVLTLGERDGGLTLWFAKQGFDVTATDLKGLTDEGKALHERYGVSEKVNYRSADMLSLPFEDNSFDLVAFKSVLGALSEKERQKKALQEIYRVLKPQGKLLFAENLVGSAFHRGMRKRFVKWSSYWRYLNVKHDRDLFEDFSQFHYRTHGTLALFGRSEAQRNILGRLDSGLRPLTPANSRYILFGVCEK